MDHDQDDPDADAEGEMDDMTAPATVATVARSISGSETENNRKRQVDRQQAPHLNGSPAKRPRLSNGYENGVDAATTPMELDGQGDNHAYPSPLEVEQAPTPNPGTDGREQAAQVEKTRELTADDTSFLTMTSNSPVDEPTPLSSSSPVRTISGVEHNDGAVSEPRRVLLHCQWHPRDPSILAAAGSDALVRIWNLASGSTTDLDFFASAGHVNGVAPIAHSPGDDDLTPKDTVVTSIAWNWDGSAIAVATETAGQAHITIWTLEGDNVDHLEVPGSSVYKLRWNPNNVALLALASDSGGASMIVYQGSVTGSMIYSLPGHDLNSEPHDAAWTSETDFLMCGRGLLLALQCSKGVITVMRTFETSEGDRFTHLQFDWVSSLAATCGVKGAIEIWDNSGKRRQFEAHCSAVTALAWQPLHPHPSDNERLLASAGEDGAVSIWNALSNDRNLKKCMSINPPFVHAPFIALAFTPDGAFIAGATTERILIWKVGHYNTPRATWSRSSHPGWISPRRESPHQDSPRRELEPDEEEVCLAWDFSGHKLAYGVNNKVSHPANARVDVSLTSI
ncbi:WD40-repeat-containing domain protein [Xylariomycetidae sp. FL2044]|nr:WD40-repeat-containing domain protein [Xylariomycetidae sp. FL2044]